MRRLPRGRYSSVARSRALPRCCSVRTSPASTTTIGAFARSRLSGPPPTRTAVPAMLSWMSVVLVVPFGRVDPLAGLVPMIRTTARRDLVHAELTRWGADVPRLEGSADVAVYAYVGRRVRHPLPRQRVARPRRRSAIARGGSDRGDEHPRGSQRGSRPRSRVRPRRRRAHAGFHNPGARCGTPEPALIGPTRSGASIGERVSVRRSVRARLSPFGE